jgi:TfoX/Sxy family transcriptional regulator of competence genes
VCDAQDSATHIVDLPGSFGRCEARRMFGGGAILHRGLMFALITDGNLYPKADDESRDRFGDLGCVAFSYHKQDRGY